MTETPRPPNFLIIGANRCGTTSLYHYLKEHPDVFMSRIKEPSFFLSQFKEMPEKGVGDNKRKVVTDFYSYCRLFEKAGNRKAVGEASPENLYYADQVIPLIRRYLGDPRIIIMLRNPVERAFSAYTHLVSEGRESLDFEEGLDQEEKRKKEGWRQIWYYKDSGFYSFRVGAYLRSFGRVKVCLFDDLEEDSLGLVREVCRFLDVDDSFAPDVRQKYKASGIPRSKTINRLFEEPSPLRSTARAIGSLFLGEDGWIKFRDRLKAQTYVRAEMKSATRGYLEAVFHDDILKLQEIIGRDLSVWFGRVEEGRR